MKRRRTWDEEERLESSVRTELRRLYLRARRRWLTVFVLAILATTGLVVQNIRKDRLYHARMTMLVSEGTLDDDDTAPPAANQLREYINGECLTRDELLKLIAKYKLYKKWMKIDRNFAVDQFRDATEVSVDRNFFIIPKMWVKVPRSAIVTIKFTYKDRELATQVLREMAVIISEKSNKQRKQMTISASSGAAYEVAELNDDLFAAKGKYIEQQLAFQNATAQEKGTIRVEMNRLTHEVSDLEERLKLALKADSALSIRKDIERNSMGLQFEVLEAKAPPPPLLPEKKRLVIFTIVMFLTMVPMMGVAVAAFDSRLYRAEDVLQLKIELYGQIPSFKGDRVGSHQSRTKAG
jgi:hypothetical protein